MNKVDLDHANVATVMILALGLVVVIIGGIVVILGNMTFEEYLNTLWKFAGAVGLLAIGRGIKAYANGNGGK